MSPTTSILTPNEDSIIRDNNPDRIIHDAAATRGATP